MLPTEGLDSCLSQPLRVADRQVLHAAVAVMNQALGVRARPEGLLERVQGQIGTQRVGRPPANNLSREGIDHKGDVYESAPRGDVAQIRHPHSWLGWIALKSRSTRSGGRSAASSVTVVLNFRPRIAP